MNKKNIIFLFLLLLLIGCTATKEQSIKSPCVSIDGGPCGPRKPINTWLNEYLSYEG